MVGRIYVGQVALLGAHGFLSVLQRTSRLLDMCAAPGSKTSQLVEALHKAAAPAVPDGVIVANDSNSKRGHMYVQFVSELARTRW